MISAACLPGHRRRAAHRLTRPPGLEQLAAIFSEVLGIEHIAVHFFDLGGHSVLAIQLVLYRTEFLDTILLLGDRPHDGLVPSCSGITGTAQSVLFDQPLGVVAGDEGADGVTDLVDGLVNSAMDDLLFEGAEETLDDAVGLGLADERVAGYWLRVSGFAGPGERERSVEDAGLRCRCDDFVTSWAVR